MSPPNLLAGPLELLDDALKVIPLLTDPGSHGGNPLDSFDVIVPSLPGHGYSAVPDKPGMSIWRAADLIQRAEAPS